MTRWTTWAIAVLLPLCVLAAGCSGDHEQKTPQAGAESGDHTAPSMGREPEGMTPGGAAEAPDYVAPQTQTAIDKGVAYLRSKQLPDGGWPIAEGQKASHLGVTVVAAYGLEAAGLTAEDPALAKALDYIVGYVKDDGGIYDEGLRNYTTSIGVMVLKEADEQEYSKQIAGALKFLRSLQWDQGEGLQPESVDFGGAGYGAHQRPDLSNTQWFIQAMKELGVSKDDPAMEKAVIFVSRTQAGEAAKGYWVSDGSGGFVYTPHGGGESKAGTVDLPSGGKGLKCYGSMTYAGFLSLIYAGLERTDPRVQAAREWVEKHWSLEVNPEMGKQGYYYYLMTMGKALRAYGATAIVDEQGTAHPWRKELSAKLVSLQRDDGSWVNSDEDRWFEGNPTLATSFALVALDACKTKL